MQSNAPNGRQATRPRTDGSLETDHTHYYRPTTDDLKTTITNRVFYRNLCNTLPVFDLGRKCSVVQNVYLGVNAVV